MARKPTFQFNTPLTEGKPVKLRIQITDCDNFSNVFKTTADVTLMPNGGLDMSFDDPIPDWITVHTICSIQEIPWEN